MLPRGKGLTELTTLPAVLDEAKTTPDVEAAAARAGPPSARTGFSTQKLHL